MISAVKKTKRLETPPSGFYNFYCGYKEFCESVTGFLYSHSNGDNQFI